MENAIIILMEIIEYNLVNETIHLRESKGAVVKLLLDFLTQRIIYSALITSF